MRQSELYECVRVCLYFALVILQAKHTRRITLSCVPACPTLSRCTFEKSSNIKFNENSRKGSRDVSCEQIDVRTKHVVVFRKFATAHEKDTETFERNRK